LESYLAEKGVLNKFHLLDIETEEGKDLIEKLGLRAVPTCVIVDDDKKEVRQCSDEDWKDILQDH